MSKIKQFVPQKICLKCQGCCCFSAKDIIWSPHLLQEEKVKFSSPDNKIPLLANVRQDNFICIFFSLCDNQCQIYLRRPFECQLYPFLLDRHNKKIFLAVDLNCPFIKEHQKNPKFKVYTQYLIRLLRSPKYKTLLKNNPQVIQDYATVLDLKELKL